jgi:hypothetical protein
LSEASWEVDQQAGTIAFVTPAGLRAVAPVQIIGTYNTGDGTWLWGWDHPSVAPPLAVVAERVRQFGEHVGVERLVTPKIRCREEECWEFTALACMLGQQQGAYRGPSGRTRVFMTFGNVTVSQARCDGTAQRAE